MKQEVEQTMQRASGLQRQLGLQQMGRSLRPRFLVREARLANERERHRGQEAG